MGSGEESRGQEGRGVGDRGARGQGSGARGGSRADVGRGRRVWRRMQSANGGASNKVAKKYETGSGGQGVKEQMGLGKGEIHRWQVSLPCKRWLHHQQ